MLIHRIAVSLLVLGCLTLTVGQGCPADTPTPEAAGPEPDSSDALDSSRPPSQTLQWFDELWSTFDQRYSYFIHKEIDWDDVRAHYRPDFEEELATPVFVERIAEMLNELHDWHVWVQAPDAEPIGYDGLVEPNFPPHLITSYTQDGVYAKIGDNVIYHALLQDGVAYVVIDTFDTAAFSSVSDADIEELFVTYADAPAMILDIRNNSGGNEDNAVKFASRFTDEPVTYGYVKTRTGPEHDDFGDWVTKVLQPSAGTHYDGIVMCLIGQRCLSSAEWFTLMMRACGATLVGDRTRGGSGNPSVFELSNGVRYAVSTWVACTDAYGLRGYAYPGAEAGDRVPIEDNGIEPDPGFYLAAEESFDDTHDYVLELVQRFLAPFTEALPATPDGSPPSGLPTDYDPPSFEPPPSPAP